MFGSRRLAKRSIIGTRVSAQWKDGRFYPGVIQATRNAQNGDTIYNVMFDDGFAKEVGEVSLIAPGFQTVNSLTLKQGQKVYITHNGREITGQVSDHDVDLDEVFITSKLPDGEVVELTRKVDDVRLMESRKSARLQDQDTDYSKLVEMHPEPKKRAVSHVIDVPANLAKSRRRAHSPDISDVEMEDEDEMEVMDEQMAAMVLTCLSASPASPGFPAHFSFEKENPICPPSFPESHLHDLSASLASSGVASNPSGESRTPSPPRLHGLSESAPTMGALFHSSNIDEGIELDDTMPYFAEDLGPKKRKNSTKTLFQCTWPGCKKVHSTESSIERHIRGAHLGHKKMADSEDLSDHEEEFYYTEIEVSVDSVADTLANMNTSSSPQATNTNAEMFAAAMARPPVSDHDYQKKEHRHGHVPLSTSKPESSDNISIPAPHFKRSFSWQYGPTSPITSSSVSPPMRMNKFSPQFQFGTSPKSHIIIASQKCSPMHKKTRSEVKKCRKVYGMENRDMWCTQCKWKKACSRFME
ncbi:zinc finger protein 395-like isoform X2 [Lineus longissimus]|uniref:zinc finger protein 395-like isoform X2 n=1 Tax=Lineus longissimus TaxID=88925 RepID=UPI00315D79AE